MNVVVAFASHLTSQWQHDSRALEVGSCKKNVSVLEHATTGSRYCAQGLCKLRKPNRTVVSPRCGNSSVLAAPGFSTSSLCSSRSIVPCGIISSCIPFTIGIGDGDAQCVGSQLVESKEAEESNACIEAQAGNEASSWSSAAPLTTMFRMSREMEVVVFLGHFLIVGPEPLQRSTSRGHGEDCVGCGKN